MTAATAIVRTKDKRDTLERALRSLRDQTADVEIVVVDSGSRDGTLDIARRWADQLIEIPAEEFTFGGALNLGAKAARTPIHLALSAHCHLDRGDWVERALAHYRRPEVVAVNGADFDRHGARLSGPVDQTVTEARADPGWGHSNHASTWRAAAWQRHPFDERLEACEDKEWGLRVLADGGVIVFDPGLTVRGDHRRAQGPRALFDRSRRESRALARAVPRRDMPLTEVLSTWWNADPRPGAGARVRGRLSPLRSAELAGRFVGRREGRGRRA